MEPNGSQEVTIVTPFAGVASARRHLSALLVEAGMGDETRGHLGVTDHVAR